MSAGSEREGSAAGGGLRISDSDRDRIASVLGQHAAEGRLTVEELDERLGSLYAALTRGQAREVMAGLPALTPPEVRHHWHHGHERDDRAPMLPEWLLTDDRAGRQLPPPGAPPALSPADAYTQPAVPTDEVMQTAYDAWRAAVTKAKAGVDRERPGAAAATPQVTRWRQRRLTRSSFAGADGPAVS